ncbi:MAG: TRAP transporter large permease [Opitutales bacterium]|nr:TRAP transporter large permease [Opitutales bacterium]
MSAAISIMLLLFALLLLLNTPIAFVLALVTAVAAYASGAHHVILTTAADMASGVESFTLLAIPFFILAGDLMGAGGLARRLIDFASSLVGRFTGGLGLVNTLTCMFFGAISGSAAAAVSSVGGTLIPEMERKGYNKELSIALTTTSATTGLLIPPSNVMIVYAVAAGNVSIAGLFLAGIMPGIVVGLFIMLTLLAICMRSGVGGRGEVAGIGEIVRSGFSALPSLLLIVVVLGGILGGVFTPTEASAIAVLWAFVLAVPIYREIPLRKLPGIVRRSARTTGVVLLLVAASRAMSQYLTVEQIPQQVSDALLSLSSELVVILAVINVLLLVVGIFMDMTPALLIFTPILLPVVTQLGVNPIHFGIIMIANLCIGLCTPPVGTCLFIGCSVGKGDVARVSRAMLPFYAAMILALVAITYFPAITMWIPNLLSK